MMIVILVDVLIVAALLAADLISKAYAASALADGHSYVAIKKVLTFEYKQNTGAAFGMFHDSRVFLCVFVGIVLLGVVAFMTYHIVKKKYKQKGGLFLHVCMSMIVAGGLGNLIDRIQFGYVRDFIDYTIVYTLFKKKFAICNVADAYLTIGVILVACYLIWLLFRESKKKKEDRQEPLLSQTDRISEQSEHSAPSEDAAMLSEAEPPRDEDKDD